MDIFQLLEEDQRYQLFILRFLDLEIDEYVTISKLVELTGQSKFKITKFIQMLNYDLNKFRQSCKIVIQDDFLTTEDIDLTVIKLLQIDYFKTSLVFQLLIYLLEERGTIENYAATHFLSTSKAYGARRQLISFLKPLGIKIKKNRLIGEEFSIRNTLSTIIFEALNGYYSPFTNKLTTFTKKINEFLTFFYNLRLTPTQKNKLNILINISLTRCIHNCPIKHCFFSDSKKIFTNIENGVKNLSEYTNINPTMLINEISYISMFLFTESLIKCEFCDVFNFNYFQILDNHSKKLSEKILSQVEHRYNVNFPIEIHSAYTYRIQQVNRKRAIYSFETSSFSTNKQIQTMNELYPIYSEIIWKVIKEAFIHKPNNGLNRYFYDYLFILIAVIPPDQIERPVYVCVDFSQGYDYTNFIIKQIEGFKDLNLCIENRITPQTDIVISDCVWEKFKGSQIVWKNPPTPSDWEFFGNSIIRIKRILLSNDDIF